MAQRPKLEGLPNFAQVTPHLYRGGQPAEVGFQRLKKMGINIVVDLRLTGAAREKEQVNALGMKYVSIPWHCYFPQDHVFVEFLKIVKENPRKKIFVHCRYGDDRTGMAIAAYRMAMESWSAADARREMQQFGFHRVLCPSLGPYEAHFPERLKTSPEFRAWRSESSAADVR